MHHRKSKAERKDRLPVTSRTTLKDLTYVYLESKKEEGSGREGVTGKKS
jgi:hypothetical protein